MTAAARLKLILVLGLATITAPAFAQTAFEDAGGGGSASGALIAVEPVVNLGNVAVGSTTQAIARFRNDGAQAITFGDLNIYPASNVSISTSLNQCSEAPLQFGGECAIVMSVKALKTGPFQAQLLIQHSGRSKLITASVAGTVDAAAEGDSQAAGEIQGTPPILDFGTVAASRPTLRTVQLRNASSDPITINSVALESPQKTSFDVRADCKEMQPSQSCLVSVIWSPLAQGPTSGFLVVNHSGASKMSNIPVQGDYQPETVTDLEEYPQPIAGKGLLVASAKEIDFGSEVDSESALTITLVNGGDTNLTINGLSLSVVAPGLAIDPSGCRQGSVIRPSEACPLTLRWAPQKIGNLTTDLRVSHDGTRGIMVIPVKGKSTAIAKGSLGFGAVTPLPPSTGGISTDLPGSAGLTLNDINELNAAMGDDISGVIARTSGKAAGTRSFAPTAVDTSAASVATYIVTSHTINRAILMGQGGSRVVTHNKPVMIEGAEWTPKITPAGVEMEAEGKTVKLLFDESLAANQNLLTDNSEVSASDGGTMQPLAESAMQSGIVETAAPIMQVPVQAETADPTPTADGDTGLPDIFAN